jgi:predicted nuclease with TOPRIM domain
MPYLLENLVIDRVDLVDEGANSAAFIEVFKRKERSNLMNISEILAKMKPEHAAVIQQELDALKETATTAQSNLDDVTKRLDDANEALATANEELENLKGTVNKAKDECSCDGEADDEGVCKSCGKPKKSTTFDETNVLKSMPEAAREVYLKMRAQKEAAEEQVRKAAEEKANADAVAKAATLKALPVEQDKLVEILKRCDSDVVDVLSTVAEAIDGVVLGEVGKSKKTDTSMTAWDKIEAEADKIVESDNITKQKAITMVIKRNPELYNEYLNGGAN